MSVLCSVVETPSYLSRAERLMSPAECFAIVDMIAAAPESGVVVKGTGGLRKLRIGLGSRGKRGGGRLIYWYHSASYPAVLLWMFAKNEADDLTAEQRKRFAAMSARLIESLGGT